jgi:hypothetical protein
MTYRDTDWYLVVRKRLTEFESATGVQTVLHLDPLGLLNEYVHTIPDSTPFSLR